MNNSGAYLLGGIVVMSSELILLRLVIGFCPYWGAIIAAAIMAVAIGMEIVDGRRGR